MKKNIYKKCLKVLMKDGTIQSLGYKNRINTEDVLGFVLGSGKVVSSNTYYGPTKFSESNLKGYPKKLIIEEDNETIPDSDGKTNTEELKKYCDNSGLLAIGCLKENEYLPSVSELLEIFDKEKGELHKLNLTRKLIGLEPTTREKVVYYWTSTIRNEDTVWSVGSNGSVYWRRWHLGWSDTRVLSFIDI